MRGRLPEEILEGGEGGEIVEGGRLVGDGAAEQGMPEVGGVGGGGALPVQELTRHSATM